jgi:hypothetical protein
MTSEDEGRSFFGRAQQVVDQVVVCVHARRLVGRQAAAIRPSRLLALPADRGGAAELIAIAEAIAPPGMRDTPQQAGHVTRPALVEAGTRGMEGWVPRAHTAAQMELGGGGARADGDRVGADRGGDVAGAERWHDRSARRGWLKLRATRAVAEG